MVFQLFLSGIGVGLRLSKKLHDRIESRCEVRVVLNVLLREVLVGELPVIRFEEIANDVKHDLLVRIELRIGLVNNDSGSAAPVTGA